MASRILLWFELILFFFIISILFSGSNLVLTNQSDKIRLFTREFEFDYFDWTLGALAVKMSQASISSPYYFDDLDQHQIVMDYMKVTEEITQVKYQINLIYSDPGIQDPYLYSQDNREYLDNLYDSQNHLAPVAEAILERQISEILKSQGLTFMGLTIPPVLFHISPLPYNIIISPRDRIEQSASVSLVSDFPINKQIELENKIDSEMNISSLVVPVGGIGSYPTMIEQSTSLDWISNTIAHEWIHNWLSIRPLGIRYGLNNDLRTMNETTASLVGDEIGNLLIRKYYPELFSGFESIYFINLQEGLPDPNNLPIVQFDFRSEMHTTRVETEKLLAEGKIEAAENYLEARRQVFWDNGFVIRKLNQAYFAFYGAYADVQGGAAGEDPVGPAVRKLRAQSPSLRVFLEKISQMTSFDELNIAISK